MTDLFYLQDSRSNVGSRATFWRAGGGYTTNLDEAETFTSAHAVRQYKCRETDLPWPVDYVRARAEYGVDHQDLDLSRTQALAGAPADDRIYVAYDRDWDGNCLVWVPEAAGRTSNLAARPRRHTYRARARALAEVLHRPACQACCCSGLPQPQAGPPALRPEATQAGAPGRRPAPAGTGEGR